MGSKKIRKRFLFSEKKRKIKIKGKKKKTKWVLYPGSHQGKIEKITK